MKLYVKHITVVFLLLMGYSQIFTYVFLGVTSTSVTRIADGAVHVQSPFVNSSIFDNAIIEEIEENKDDRNVLNIHSKLYDSIAALFLPISRVEPGIGQTHFFTPFLFKVFFKSTYINLRVIRL